MFADDDEFVTFIAVATVAFALTVNVFVAFSVTLTFSGVVELETIVLF